MITDWVLVRRLGYEIETRLRGARVQDAGLLADGRIALLFRVRGASALLAIDVFASPPAVTIESGELGIAAEPGFVRTLAGTLRGMALGSVRARRDDRLLRLTFASRSRFGVGDTVELFLELVPRFGNAVLVKGETVVAAAKEFSLAENPSRAVAAGLAYVPAPLPARASEVPRLVAEAGLEPKEFLGFATGDAVLREPLYVYRRAGRIVQAYVVPLAQFADAACAREDSLLDVFAALRDERAAQGERAREQRRRDALLKRLAAREQRLRAELASLAEKRRGAAERDGLRREGERIFGSLHELDPAERDEAKDRASKLFARYKKLGATIPHIERRERTVRSALEAVDALRWEAERTGEEDLADVEAAVAQLDPHRSAPRTPAGRKRKRPPLEMRTANGSRIVVGRSPTENADVTFHIARPNDLWFHAQGIPGAHVILARDDRSEPDAQDIEAAASLAAFYSKAKASAKVPIDYTLRKYVRKQRDAPPGLVWYTNPKTIVAQPRAAPEPGTS